MIGFNAIGFLIKEVVFPSIEYLANLDKENNAG